MRGLPGRFRARRGGFKLWLNKATVPPVKIMSKYADYTSASDEELVGGAKKGELGAFEELVARHRDKIYARAFSMMRNEDEAVDLSQEAWVKGWQRLEQFQGDSSFATWITRIVTNPTERLERGELRQRIEKALEQMSHEHRTVVVLHEFEEMEYKEIAKAMQCSIGTVMSRLFYARRKLAALLADLKNEN